VYSPFLFDWCILLFCLIGVSSFVVVRGAIGVGSFLFDWCIIFCIMLLEVSPSTTKIAFRSFLCSHTGLFFVLLPVFSYYTGLFLLYHYTGLFLLYRSFLTIPVFSYYTGLFSSESPCTPTTIWTHRRGRNTLQTDSPSASLRLA
jgi:hypothetical protein